MPRALPAFQNNWEKYNNTPDPPRIDDPTERPAHITPHYASPHHTEGSSTLACEHCLFDAFFLFRLQSTILRSNSSFALESGLTRTLRSRARRRSCLRAARQPCLLLDAYHQSTPTTVASDPRRVCPHSMHIFLKQAARALCAKATKALTVELSFPHCTAHG